MTGALPAALSALTALRTLTLYSTNVSRQLPDEWNNIRLAQVLLLNATRLTGTVPVSWSVMADLQLLAVPPQLCDSLETDVLQEAAASAGSCTMRALDDSPLDEVLIGVVASVCTAVLLLAVLGVAVAAHRSHCEDPQCAHRHPGLVHSLVGHLSPGTRSAQCAWCMWDGKPDLAVPFAELEPLLEPHAVIGRGGFSKVFRGTWRGRPVAIKLLDMSALGGDEATQRAALANEIDLSVRCNECPHMVRLYGACPEGVCLINELVDGGTLDARIHGDAAAPMQLLEALHVARDIAGGLVFLHPQLVHRDLKPQNILLLHDGRAKIIDFGLGRVNENPLRTHATTDSAGTAAYMAPEQSDGHVSQKVDIFALGVILNECLSGEVPFASYSHPMQVQIAVAMRQERPKLAADCPRAVRATIERCWHQEPAHRPTAVEVAFILDHLIKAEIGLREEDSSVQATVSRMSACPESAKPQGV